MTKQDLIEQIEQWHPRSAWDKGVKELMFTIVEYEARDVVEELTTTDFDQLYKLAKEWSYDGHLNIYDDQIAKQFCTTSELKINKNGRLPPNSKELWVDLQSRACYQAFRRLQAIIDLNCF